MKKPVQTSLSEQQTQCAAWHAKAPTYDEFLGRVTCQVVEALLDAAQVCSGMSLLDVATGPGYGAGGAAARGADAIGVDFAPGMITEATRNFPKAHFQQGDGTSLDFPDGQFDAVICSFGLMLMPDPQLAVREAFRVLSRRGRFAYSIWDPIAEQSFFGLVSNAVQKHGDTAALPAAATSGFRLTDHHRCCDILTQAGLHDVKLTQLQAQWEPAHTRQILDMIYHGTVRTAALLQHQSEGALARIHNAIIEGAKTYAFDTGYRFVWPVAIVSGQKA